MPFQTESIDGALLVDKPAGITSAEVIRKLKKIHSFKKIGHAGTLDPMATGLLVILLGKGTRLQEILLSKEKKYSGEILLGYETNSDDVTGEVTEGSPENTNLLSEESFDKIKHNLLSKFTGSFLQTPPKVSAIKIKGKAAYKLEREGKDFEISSRNVFVSDLKLGYESSNSMSYDVTSHSGFYVRSLARDIGKELKTLACLKSIRREKCSGFDLNDATTLEELLDPDISLPLMDIESMLESIPKLEFEDEDCLKLKSGIQIILEDVDLDSKDNLAAVYSNSGELCALIERKKELKIANSPDALLADSQGKWKLRFVF